MRYPTENQWWITPVAFGYGEREAFRSGVQIGTYWALADTLITIGLEETDAWSIDEILM